MTLHVAMELRNFGCDRPVGLAPIAMKLRIGHTGLARDEIMYVEHCSILPLAVTPFYDPVPVV